MKKGFTLVELSIVLVIIGLLVGGVLQGQELIEASKRQSMISDLTRFQTALNTFRLQYDARPGDFDEADEYWAECVDGGGTACNGNGNGSFSNTGKSNGYSEGLRAWQHMSLAEIIKGSYDGLFSDMAFGKTYPESSFSAVGYQFIYIGANTSCSGNSNHSLYGAIFKDIRG